ncbi:hypothetical protein [Klebsiella sp. BIGb0407]|uniref:hypothetical protein n=1 Tax=Klebsiella sp. BIGb0407 TaxID=2940603 RepID=UPI0021698A09|nr:hypothetical protein [Klebsiella sp. BIGb0407]MCS3434220.1 putative DNA-binding protein (UPF0251 family) [Klebsiella sp. BIGb0407]
MCALDRSSDICMSQSLRTLICHVDALYGHSPVAVCVRSQHNTLLFSNITFQQLNEHFKTASDKNTFLSSYEGIVYILLQMELDCIALGEGCIINKIFPYGNDNFQISIECIKTDSDEFCVFWKLNRIINIPLESRKKQDLSSDDVELIDKVLLGMSDLNLLPLSFYVLGFGQSDISSFLGVSENIVKKRIERAKVKISKDYPSFEVFILDCYKTRKIYFFVESAYEYIMLQKC